MDLILLENIDKVGYKYEVVSVKNGYGRNYLIPHGKALIANKSNLMRLEEFRKREQNSAEKQRDHIQEITDKLKNEVVKIGAKVGDSGQIFGSVNNLQLSQQLKEQLGIEVDKRRFEILEEVKRPGTYSAKVNLHDEIDTILNFEVVKE